MDHRFNDYLDNEYVDGNTVFLRNAGSNIKELEGSIKNVLDSKENEITKIVLLVHGAFGDELHSGDACAAMKTVHSAITNPSSIKDATLMRLIGEGLVDQFRTIDCTKLKTVEEANVHIQMENLEKFLKSEGKRPGIDIEIVERRIQTSTVYKDDGVAREKTFKVIEPSTSKFNTHSYIIQGTGLTASIELAKSLGIKELSKNKVTG